MPCKCNKCNHEWFSRTPSKPVQCPKCKTYGWEKKVIKKVTNEKLKGE